MKGNKVLTLIWSHSETPFIIISESQDHSSTSDINNYICYTAYWRDSDRGSWFSAADWFAHNTQRHFMGRVTWRISPSQRVRSLACRPYFFACSCLPGGSKKLFVVLMKNSPTVLQLLSPVRFCVSVPMRWDTAHTWQRTHPIRPHLSDQQIWICVFLCVSPVLFVHC